jgi:hypothetical protein
MGRLGRPWRVVLWILDVFAIALMALILMVPTLDYARREHLRWYLHPSPETLSAFQSKQREEFLVRLGVATPIAVAALALAVFLLRSPGRKPEGN